MRNKLKEKRLGLGLTQSEIAAKVGITNKAYSHIELGIRNPSIEVAQKIANILGTTDINLF